MHYIVSGQGQVIQWCKVQAVNEAFTTGILVICCKFQKNCTILGLYIDFLMILNMQGQITPMW